MIVDDEPAIRDVVSALLEDEGFEPRAVADSDAALAEFERREPGLILLDIWLEGSRLDGVQLLDHLLTIAPHLPIVMFSGHGTIETAVAAIKRGAYDFIEKPFDSNRLLLAVRNALEAAKLRAENLALRERVEGSADLLGDSPVIAKLRAAIKKVAPTGSRILITGPAGSGKEVVARAVHSQSTRADAPFVVLSPGALDRDAVETSLFGCEPGVGGAERRVIGALERAQGGTLLLDEVADMSLDTQSKVLRALQSQTYTRVGGAHRLTADVRMIGASSKDLHAEIAAGRFREDLYYRLNVVPLSVPRLAERRVDVPILAESFMARLAQETGAPARPISPAAMAVLQSADWPGNVRQLKNVVEWMLIMAPGSPGSAVDVDGVPADLVSDATSSMSIGVDGEVMSLPLREARERFERAYLHAQLGRFGGNISRTASFVGMERSALHRKLKALGLNNDDH